MGTAGVKRGVAERPDAGRAYRVEQRGIAFVPEAERWARPRDLFGMWAGASFNVEYLVYGAILTTFGFSFAQSVLLIVLGNLSYLLVGVASLQGPDAGTTAFVINRAPFGPSGSRLISAFNWLTMVGFETEGLILVILAGEVLMDKAGYLPGVPAKVVLVVVGVCLQLALPFLGHASVVKTLRLLVVPFVILYGVLAGLTLGRAHLGLSWHGPGWQVMLVGFAFTVVLSGLGWTECGNDYSRYLPRKAAKGAIIWWVFLGTAIPQILIMMLGAAVASYAPSVATEANPFAAFDSPHVVAAGFVVPFVVVAVVQLLAINSLDLYSSGVTLQALGLPLRRWQAVIVDTVICCGLTIYAVFASSFATLLRDFVDVVVVWIAPWLAIYLVDWWLRGRRYVALELQRSGRDGLYFRHNGVCWSAVAAQLTGMVATLSALAPTFRVPSWMTEISTATGGADLSVFVGPATAGMVYFALSRRRLREESARQALLLAETG